MTKAEFAVAIQREFDSRLQTKTGWGRKEVAVLLREVIRDIALDAMDEVSLV